MLEGVVGTEGQTNISQPRILINKLIFLAAYTDMLAGARCNDTL